MLFAIDSYTLDTVLPMTTWNWPPASTTVMTPLVFSTAALSTLSRSLIWKRSRVAQCVTAATLCSPPTPRRISSASKSYFVAVATIYSFESRSWAGPRAILGNKKT